MRIIETSIYSHESLETGERVKLKQVQKGEAPIVRTYSDLMKKIAFISHYNKDFMLFFRGQTENFVRGNGITTLYPSIYRGSFGKNPLKERVQKLNHARHLLADYFRVWRLPGMKNILKMEELCWAILQHYEVCPTPLLDLTHSLRVACSFACHGNASEYGYVYVFGLPYTTNRISYNLENDLLNMRLVNICPPNVLRPYFQDAYLVGTFPADWEVEEREKLDFNRRLLARFRIPTQGFWTSDFQSIPESFLFPSEPEIQEVFQEIRNNIG